MKRIYKLMVGNKAEQTVCDKLRQSGYRILARNYMTRQGEIDIIAYRNETVCFIEVKSLREGHTPFRPEDSVTYRKIKTIKSVATTFLQMMNGKYDIDTDTLQYRFDVAAVVFEEPYRVVSFEYFEAFYTLDSFDMEREIYAKNG